MSDDGELRLFGVVPAPGLAGIGFVAFGWCLTLVLIGYCIGKENRAQETARRIDRQRRAREAGLEGIRRRLLSRRSRRAQPARTREQARLSDDDSSGSS